MQKLISSLFILLAYNPLLIKAQNSGVFDFIDSGQKMEVVRDKQVSKEILYFDSPIDSLKANASIIRIYGKDGRELSNTYFLDDIADRTYRYEYSTIYPKAKVCSSSEINPTESCYDLIFQEDEGKVYKSYKNGFIQTVFKLTPYPFDLDRKYNPIIQHFIINSYIDDSTNTNNRTPNFDNLDKSKMSRAFVKEKVSYKISSSEKHMEMKIKRKQWWNKKRRKQLDSRSKVVYDPISNQMSFHVAIENKHWIMEKVKSFDKEGLFIGQEVFYHSKPKKLSEKLILSKDDHYKMEVLRSPTGLARKIYEYVNDELVFITTYEYEYYD